MRKLIVTVGVLAALTLTYSGCNPMLRPAGRASFGDWWELRGEAIYFADWYTVRVARGTGYRAAAVLRESCGTADGFVGYARPTRSPDGKYLLLYRISGTADKSTLLSGATRCTNVRYHSVEVALLELAGGTETILWRIANPQGEPDLQSFGNFRFLTGHWNSFMKQRAAIGSAPAPDIDPFKIHWADDSSGVSFNFDGDSYDYSVVNHVLTTHAGLRSIGSPASDACFFASSVICPSSVCGIPAHACSFDILEGRYSVYPLQRQGVGAVVFLAARNNATGESFTVAPYFWAPYMS